MYWWRRICVALFLLSFVLVADALPMQWAFRVSFTDKQGSSGDINNPIAFLSQRALDRRNRQSIAVDSTDLPVPKLYIDSVLQLTGGVFHCTSRWMNDCVVLLTDSSKILTLQGKTFVKSVALVGTYDTGLHMRTTKGNKFSLENMPVTMPVQLRTSGSSTDYGLSYNQVSMVNGDYLHDIGLKGEGMLISVLDAGFEGVNTHPGFDSLRLSGRLIDVYDFLLHDSNTVFNYSNHGISVLSAMAGNMPGTYIGSAPHAMYALYRTEDDLSGDDRIIEMDNLVAGAERADSLGTDVINTSVGYYNFENPYFSYTQADLDGKTTFVAKAVIMATKKGILFVSSAGNQGSGGLLSPGDCDSALSVGMVGFNGSPDPGSGYGPNAAGHIKPDVTAAGSPAYVFLGSVVSARNGTSFSTPQIAGWAACLWQGAKPGTTPYKLRDAIDRSADHYTNPGIQIGYGIPNFKTASAILGVSDTTKIPETSDFIAVWPNAFSTDLKVEINASVNQTIQFCMIDMSGKTVWRASQAVVKGKQWWHVAVPGGLPGGMYLFKAVGENQQQVVKLVKI